MPVPGQPDVPQGVHRRIVKQPDALSYAVGTLIFSLGTLAVLGWIVMGDAQEDTRRWVRRKQNFYIIIVIYLALSVLWFTIDMLSGTDDFWFYWPMLGAGVIVAIIGIAMFGISGIGHQERPELRRATS